MNVFVFSLEHFSEKGYEMVLINKKINIFDYKIINALKISVKKKYLLKITYYCNENHILDNSGKILKHFFANTVWDCANIM